MSVLKILPLLLCAAPLFPQTDKSDSGSSEASYAGPSVLSRGSGPGGPSLSSIRYRPYIGVNGVYNSQLNGVSVGPNGNVISGGSEGVELSYGISGTSRWKGTVLSLNYHGDFRHYTRASYYDGTDQGLDLWFQHQLTRHILFNVGVSGGTYNYRFGYTGSYGFYDPAFTQNSTADLFDNRTIFGQTTARLIYQKSARLSFSFGGAGYLSRRRSTALYGSTGYGANADVSYRLTRFLTFGADYAYYHFDFIRVFGSSDIQTLAGNVSWHFSKSWDFSVRAGAFRAENLLLQVVAVDPVIALITGQTGGIVANYNVVHAPMFNARLGRSFHNGNCGAAYARGVTPGNGVFLTSRADTASGDCSYTGQRLWTFSAGGSYNALSALDQSIAQYRYVDWRAGTTRTIRKNLFFTAHVDVLDNLTQYAAFPKQRYYQAAVGFTFSPGDRPLVLW